MLTLALSMVGYGILVKTESLGGSDGFNLGRVTLLGQSLADAWVGFVLYAISVFLACSMAYFCRIYFDSTRGLITQAIRENELRVEYLGGSVRHTMAINFFIAAFLGGCGGAMAVMALGHIDPTFSYWTTSGNLYLLPSWRVHKAWWQSCCHPLFWKLCVLSPAPTFQILGS